MTFNIGDIVYIRDLNNKSATGQTKMIKTVWPDSLSEFRLVRRTGKKYPGWWIVEELDPSRSAMTFGDHSGIRFMYSGGVIPAPKPWGDYWANNEANEASFVLKEKTNDNN